MALGEMAVGEGAWQWPASAASLCRGRLAALITGWKMMLQAVALPPIHESRIVTTPPLTFAARMVIRHGMPPGPLPAGG